MNQKISIGLTDPKSPSNVGAVMRAAGCYSVNEVLYTGQRYAKVAKFHTDTKNALKKIPLTQVDSFLNFIADESKEASVEQSLTEQNREATKLICVELVEGATPLPEFVHPETDKVLYIFGPEDGTIKQEVINKADAVVYIPTVGCMNLAATVNVLLYDRLAKSKTTIANDALIRKSRDTNNRAKIV